MNIGLSTSCLEYCSSSFWTFIFALFQTSITFLNLSSSVIKPLLNCLFILSTNSFPSFNISPLFLLVTISLIAIVIPAFVEYLKPKSFNLSRNIEVSVVLYLLNTCAITLSKSPFANGLVKSISFIFSFISSPLLEGIIFSIFSLLASFTYWNVSGNISLNLILPTVVIKYLSIK